MKMGLVLLIIVIFALQHRAECRTKVDIANPCTPTLSKNGLSSVLTESSLLFSSNASTSDVEPGDALCTNSKLDPSLKQNKISIGIVGDVKDPLFASLMKEDTTNCSSTPKICPIPGD